MKSIWVPSRPKRLPAVPLSPWSDCYASNNTNLAKNREYGQRHDPSKLKNNYNTEWHLTATQADQALRISISQFSRSYTQIWPAQINQYSAALIYNRALRPSLCRVHRFNGSTTDKTNEVAKEANAHLKKYKSGRFR